MAVVVNISFKDLTNADYDAVMAEAGLVGASADQVPGLIAHYAFEENGRLRVVDIFESAEDWQATMAEKIGPAAARAGVAVNPEAIISELHNSMV
ncbi:MAG: hypothetical protein E6R14_08390 [Thermomicrobiales bacterium]|nr:MAG: hypothetical protein E6R14_08390 [Thermomicrobiales bacterium]